MFPNQLVLNPIKRTSQLKRPRICLLIIICILLVFMEFETGIQAHNKETKKNHDLGTNLQAIRTTNTFSSDLQGYGPFAIAITKDGQYAYLSFDLSEVIFKIRLTDLAIVDFADLIDYFPIECENIVLDRTEKKLFIYTPSWKKLLVLDTDTMTLVHLIDNINIIGLIQSQHGPSLITWDGGNKVILINTETYEKTELLDDRIMFKKIRESKFDQHKWFILSQSSQQELAVGDYNYELKTWNYTVIPQQISGEGLFDFEVLANEQKAYIGTFGGWYPEYHAFGWLYCLDLIARTLKVVPIDGAALCLVASSDSQKIFIGTGWPIPNDNNLLVVDTLTDKIVSQIQLGETIYGWPFTQMNDLQIDPLNPNLLYATSCDANAFFKADINKLTLQDVKILNKEDFNPHNFVENPSQAKGYILIKRSSKAFVFNPNSANVETLIEFPSIRNDAESFDIAFINDQRMLIAQGEAILEVEAESMHLVASHPLSSDIPSFWHFNLSNDKSEIYAITEGSSVSDTLVVIDSSNYQMKSLTKLDGGTFNSRPFVLPDDSKLYALGGMQNGSIVIHAFNLDSYTIQKTIIYDAPGLLGISAGPYFPFSFDSSSNTLFVGATHVVLAIDTVTDTISKVIRLRDVASAAGLDPHYLTYINVMGLKYNAQQNNLFCAHLDRSFISIYDLSKNQFLPKVIPLRGYFPNFMFSNNDTSKIYTLNGRSDSISVIDTNTKRLESVLDLHDYKNISIVYAPLRFTGKKVLNRSLSQAEYINILTWQANPKNEDITKYRIYQMEDNNRTLLIELNADTFRYLHRGVIENKSYIYSLVAVNDEGREGIPATITIQ